MSLRKLAGNIVFGAFFLCPPSIAADNSMPAADGERVDANGMPTTHSTPAEQAATAALNNQVSDANRMADAQADQNNAQYQQQQQQYQDQLQQHQAAMQENQADQQRFENRTAAYEALRARYAAERAAYHRSVWPARYSRWTLDESDPGLKGQRVEIIDGDRVGTVVDIAHAPNAHVEALLVQLDSDKLVWIDQADVRYDRADGIVMTNLDRSDLHQMADERG
jgi:hypothetical protein